MDHKDESNPESPQGEQLKNNEVDISKDIERMALASDWAKAAHEVAEMTQQPKAISLVDSYLTDSAVGHETQLGVRNVATSSDNPPKVVLVPVLPGDYDVNKRTRATLSSQNSGMAAAYYEGSPGFISLNGRDAMSPTWKGILLLHELAHADAHETQKHRGQNYKEVGWWDEETEVFEFEHELMTKVGGEPYAAYIREQLENFLAKYDDSNIATGGAAIPSLVDKDRLEDIFGPSSSETEARIRDTAVWFDVVYRMFDHIYGADSQRDKRGFTKLVYTMNSIG